MEELNGNAEVELLSDDEETSHEVEERRDIAEDIVEEENEKSPEVLGINNSAILSEESQKQILKEESEAITIAILKRREEELSNVVAQKQKLIDDLKKENEAAKNKLAGLVEKRKMVKEQVEAAENIVKHFMDYTQKLQGSSEGFAEKYRGFAKNCKKLDDKALKLQEYTVSIAAYKNRYEEIEEKKTALKRIKDGNSNIKEEINKMQKEIAKVKNVTDDEVGNIQKLVDEKLEISNTLLSKKEQLKDLKNNISNEEGKLVIKSTLCRAVEEKDAKLKEFEQKISICDEEIIVLTKQHEENSITLNNNQITLQNLKESTELMKNKAETAEFALKNIVQKTSGDVKTSRDRREALEGDLMKLNEEVNEKNRVLLKSKEALLRLIEEKNSLQTQQLNKQKDEEVKGLHKIHLDSRKEYLQEILESRQKLNKQHEEFLAHSATSLLKMNKEKDYLNANINYMNDMQDNLKDQTDRLKVRSLKLQKEKEVSDKNVAEKHQRVEGMKRSIQGAPVRPGILKKTVPPVSPKRVRFEKRLSDSTTDSSQTSEHRTTAEKLFDELKSNEKK